VLLGTGHARFYLFVLAHNESNKLIYDNKCLPLVLLEVAQMALQRLLSFFDEANKRTKYFIWFWK